MESYSALAASYDELTQDVGYEKRAAFVEKLFLRSHIPVHTVLDLACGTGTMTALLTERGYELIGVDGSEDMLLEAREKAQTLTGVPPLFLHQSMPELDLYGTVDFAFAEVTAVLELAKGGRVKILAVAADQRVPNALDVPTMSEAGLPGFEAYTWVGAMVSAKTPTAETAKLAALFTTVAKMDETRAFYERLGATPMTGGPAQMHEFQKGEIALWKRIVQQAKVPLQ